MSGEEQEGKGENKGQEAHTTVYQPKECATEARLSLCGTGHRIETEGQKAPGLRASFDPAKGNLYASAASCWFAVFGCPLRS
jgi:hypothetical protein